jgi:hypothetical protein
MALSLKVLTNLLGFDPATVRDATYMVHVAVKTMLLPNAIPQVNAQNLFFALTCNYKIKYTA